MKILIVSDAWRPQVNGVVRTYEDLNHYLENQGHHIRVISPCDFPHRHPLPFYPEIELVFNPSARLRRMIDDFAPDTIHIATEGPLGWAARHICLKRGWPFTTAYHTHFPDYVALRAARCLPFLYNPVRALCIGLIRRFHRPSMAVMTTTPSVEETLQGWRLHPPLHRLTRGVNTDIFHPGPKDLFQDIPHPVALYVGRVAIEKNIEAFLSMDWNGSKVVVGDGPGLPALKKKFPDAIFTGRKSGSALAGHYRSADVFVFPSRTETFGIVLIEAMACGLPIAGYNVTGPADVVTSPLLGAVDDDLAGAARQALNAPGSREDRYAYLTETYSWAVASRQFIDAQNCALIAE
jgi:glycosyltransferase involved in cell wall biosynthesis